MKRRVGALEARGRADLGDRVDVVGVAFGDQRLVDAGVAVRWCRCRRRCSRRSRRCRCRRAIVSPPRKPVMRSLPSPPSIASTSAVPRMMSSPSPPLITGSPANERRRDVDVVVAVAGVDRDGSTEPFEGSVSVPGPGSKSVLLSSAAGRGRQVVRDQFAPLTPERDVVGRARRRSGSAVSASTLDVTAAFAAAGSAMQRDPGGDRHHGDCGEAVRILGFMPAKTPARPPPIPRSSTSQLPAPRAQLRAQVPS